MLKKPWQLLLDNRIWTGNLFLPDHPKALVLFAHGSGSGKSSSRNNFIAGFLQENGIASLLFDLTTPSESESGYFDLSDFGKRLSLLTEAVKKDSVLDRLPVFYFGGSTGAAVAIDASVRQPEFTQGIICRGGRVDLAGHLANQVNCPVLLIVGDRDSEVKEMNRIFFRNLNCPKTFETIPDAGHLFEEPGTLEEVAEITVNWLHERLSERNTSSAPFLKSTDKAHV
jgi:putative phosphoribosyl transferase